MGIINSRNFFERHFSFFGHMTDNALQLSGSATVVLELRSAHKRPVSYHRKLMNFRNKKYFRERLKNTIFQVWFGGCLSKITFFSFFFVADFLDHLESLSQ